MKALRYVLPYIKEHPVLWVIGLIIPCFASLASGLILAFALSYFTELMAEANVSFFYLIGVMALVLATILVATLIEDVGRFAFSIFIINTEGGIKQDVFASVLRAKYNELSKLNRGEIISIYNNNVNVAITLITYDIFAFVYPFILGIGYLTVIFLTNTLIGALMFALTLSVFLLSIYFINHYTRIERKRLVARDEYVMSTEGMVKGRMSIRLLSAQGDVARVICNISKTIENIEKERVHLDALKALTHGGLTLTSSTLIAPLACLFVAQGMLPIASIAIIIQLCRSLVPILADVGSSINNINVHCISSNRVRELLTITSEYNKSGELLLERLDSPLLCADQLTIHYGDKRIVSEFSFVVERGEIIAIIGPSGSGKSSIVRAILGLAEYTGSLEYMGQEISGLQISSLRQSIAYVPEHNEVLSGTIMDNLSWISPNASSDELQETLEKVGLSSELLKQEVGERGEKISGGQRQRVAIARSLLRGSSLILFDEPTASLDPVSEQKIIETIIGLKEQGKGLVIITHRESTASIADRIYSINMPANYDDFVT